MNNTQLKYYLQPYWCRIKIIIYYRRYYSWIVSLHNQQYKHINIIDRKPLHEYLNNVKQMRTIYHSYYTIGALHRYQQNYGPRSMFTETTLPSNDGTIATKITTSSLHYDDNNSDNSSGNYDDGESATSIHVYNLHDPQVSNSLMEHFFCTVLANATNTCQETQRLVKDGTLNHKVNPTIPFIYEDLVYYAQQYEYIRSTISYDTSDLIRLTQHRQEITLGLKAYEFDSFAVTCPTRTALDILLQFSHMAEEELFPRTYHDEKVGGKDQINQDFQMAIETNIFCSIDATLLLLKGDTNQWKEFFQSL